MGASTSFGRNRDKFTIGNLSLVSVLVPPDSNTSPNEIFAEETDGERE